ncbi:CehA/McbA family metallohydrolase [Pseudoduganella sp. UC29_106]|uniref:CehA/McbA family metallohydrolase n=1 Tax=Pseudoduganella sp. UC29_106 TaxID=3374553 RepID=UPI003757F3D3
MTSKARRLLSAPALALLLAAAAGAAPAASAQDLVLRGTLDGNDHQRYRKLPFTVPAGVERVTIRFSYTGKAERSVIDLGVIGPDGEPRGWSGGNKDVITISSTDATPSYLPMPHMRGEWAVLMGVPNLRKTARADYTAEIFFSRGLNAADEPALLRMPLKPGPGWFRGDLHSHTAHSDGSCKSQSGKSVPCPMFLTAKEASDRKLDFLAITEHNGIAHSSGIRELQPYFDKTLLMPGREITTFYGHANLFGTVAPLDFRVAPDASPDWNTLLSRAAQLKGLVSINHPVRPSGEDCMGCGWEQPTDMRLVQAIEAVNGPDADTPWSGVPFWEKQLNAGHRIAAIGGSDSHRPDEHGIGKPATVVYAPELSQLAILQGIRAGHVFVDVTGAGTGLLDVRAREAMMGDALAASAGARVPFRVQVSGMRGAQLRVTDNGRVIQPLRDAAIGGDESRLAFDYASDGQPHWVRIDVVSAEGKLLLLGNPVYLNH